MTDQPGSLGSFLDSLDRRLQTMSSEELRASLLRYAQGLQSADRDAFVAIFGTDKEASQVEESTDLTWPIEHDPLLDAIDAFVLRLESGEYFDGFGWDDELDDERSFGDESWICELENFLEQAHHAFVSGRLGLARAAYQRLLGALTLDEEIGTFSGPEPAISMVETELAQTRYLRAIYETTPANERAQVLAQAWFDLPDQDAEVSLATVRESRRHELPDFEHFLPKWINTLHSIHSTGSQARKLLTEATVLLAGVDGLRDLARRAGFDRSEHYLEWVQALRRTQRDYEAASAAREALQRLEDNGPVVALIAEELADLSQGDTTQQLEARRSAWRAAPNQARLLAVYDAAARIGVATEVLNAELEAMGSAGDVSLFGHELYESVAILAERTDHVMQVLDESADAQDRADRGVLVPYLLASGCSGPRHPDWSSSKLAAYLKTVNLTNLWSGFTGLSRTAGRHESSDTLPMSALFVEKILEQQESEAVLSRRLDAAVQAVERHVEQIVSTTDRRQYDHAAHRLACCTEALIMANRTEAAMRLIRHWKAGYPRHVAFQRALDAAIRKSPIFSREAER